MPKVASIGKGNERGSSTLEILIAFAVLIMALTAATMIAFGNQTMTLDATLALEALTKAETGLANARANIDDGHSTITDFTPCLKQVASDVTWKADPNRPQNTTLTSLIAGIDEAIKLGQDCDPAIPASDWQNFTITHTGGAKLDVKNGIIFASTTVGALDAAGDYLYAVGLDNTNQLQITNLATHAVITATLPKIEQPGLSIFYYDQKIYIGAHFEPCPASCSPDENNEFHIFDVTDSTNPVWQGSKDIDNNVTAIIVRGKYAYLATSGNARELIILDISNPADITTLATFDAGGGQNGTSLFLLGNKLYLGRQKGSQPNFYIVDITDPTAPTSCPTCSINLSGKNISGVRVAGNLAFVATDKSLEILDIHDPTQITIVNSLPLASAATGLDLENNIIYLAP